MEPIKFETKYLCEHKDEWKRYSFMYMGPIKEILGPWYHHFEDHYICDKCKELQKNIT